MNGDSETKNGDKAEFLNVECVEQEEWDEPPADDSAFPTIHDAAAGKLG
jgi:hypothetical protein